MAYAMGEPAGERCAEVIRASDSMMISAATLVELLIVAHGKGVEPAVEALLQKLPLEVVDVTQHAARQAVAAHRRWGRGNHPAKLNFGDCFTYALAQERGCPLLFVGDDFAQTDVRAALQD